MTIPSSTRVLIVGAGPAGMSCALSLWRAGVKDFVIVDAIEEGNGNRTSRAMAVHAATLEALESIGCTDAFLELGLRCSRMKYYDRAGHLLMGADFNGLRGKTQFPCYLLIPQNISEGILDQKLKDTGIPVYRPYQVVDIRESPKDSNVVDVSFENGQSISAQYVIGADGSRSIVRQLCGLPFEDPGATPDKPEAANSLAQMVMADITFDGTPYINDEFFACISLKSFFAMAHLKYPANGSNDFGGKAAFRLVCGIPHSDGAPPSKSSVEYVQELIEKYGPRSLSSDRHKNPRHTLKVTEVVWSTRFRSRYATAPTYFTRFGSNGSGEVGLSGARVCLIGDAAHIQPPTGGQGMNLSVRDGILLGPVLAEALAAGSTPESDKSVRALLNLRRDRAIRAIKVAKFMAGALGMSPRFQKPWKWSPVHVYTFRDWTFWVMSKSKRVRRAFAFKLSGIGAP